MKLKMIYWLILLLFLLGCSPSESAASTAQTQPSNTPSITLTHTTEPLLTATQTPSLATKAFNYMSDDLPTSTDTPTITATPQVSPTPTNTPALNAVMLNCAQSNAILKGIRLTYANTDGLWLYELDGSPQKLADQGQAPHFSPDGNQILFTQYAQTSPAGFYLDELRVVNIDGSDEKVLVHPEDLPSTKDSEARILTSPRWLTDNHTILFQTYIECGHCDNTGDDLWQVDIQTGEITQILPGGEGGKIFVSPDETHLIISTPTSLKIADINGDNLRLLASFDNNLTTNSEGAFYPQPVWSPDSSFALVAIGSNQNSGIRSTYALWHLPVEGEIEQIGTAVHNFYPQFGTPEWSPDLRYLTYQGLPEKEDDLRALVIADQNGGNPVVYASKDTTRSDYPPPYFKFLGWSPDSQHFLFRMMLETHIYLGQIGAAPLALDLPVDHFAHRSSIRWSDDKTFIQIGDDGNDYYALVTQVDGQACQMALAFDGDSPLRRGNWDVYQQH